MGKHHTEFVGKIFFGIVVTSDKIYQGRATDEIVPLVEEIISKNGYEILTACIVPNDSDKIKEALSKAVKEGCHVVVVTGGTGLSSRDISVDVIEKEAWRSIPGFGELFRLLTFKEKGTVAWLSRASAFIVKADERKSLVFITPGNPQAVKMALEKIILPEVRHAVAELLR
ncbi:MAG: molybdenum cofactor biosynthesis protein MoaB [Thermoproteales archaeon]|nr:molybdenum cofactor biosynthesis protein MoaB [Thermoproteales archaeon]RLE65730.1 MAG: molybdenum cofactor biosynthesis protein MoaB [Thermoprotei archaeon]